MTEALKFAVEEAEKLSVEEQEAVAAILREEIASEQRWSACLIMSGSLLNDLADEALPAFKSGISKPLDELVS